MLGVALPQQLAEAFVDRAWSHDDDVLIPVEAIGDPGHEVIEMLDPAPLLGRLPATATAVPYAWVVADVLRAPMVGWHVRNVALDGRPATAPADDKGGLGIDPDESPGPFRGGRQGASRQAQHGDTSLLRP